MYASTIYGAYVKKNLKTLRQYGPQQKRLLFRLKNSISISCCVLSAGLLTKQKVSNQNLKKQLNIKPSNLSNHNDCFQKNLHKNLLNLIIKHKNDNTNHAIFTVSFRFEKINLSIHYSIPKTGDALFIYRSIVHHAWAHAHQTTILRWHRCSHFFFIPSISPQRCIWL